jgi:hypothetical protein
LTQAHKVVIILSMNNDISNIIVLIWFTVGAYYFGKQIGIRGTIDFLEEKGLLSFDDEK